MMITNYVTEFSASAALANPPESGIVDKVLYRVHTKDTVSGVGTAQEGITQLPPPGEPFIPFSEVTLTVMRGWVGEEQIEIERQKNIAVISAELAAVAAQPVVVPIGEEGPILPEAEEEEGEE